MSPVAGFRLLCSVAASTNPGVMIDGSSSHLHACGTVCVNFASLRELCGA